MSDRITSEAIVCLLTNKTKNPPIFQYCYFNCFRFYISKPIADYNFYQFPEFVDFINRSKKDDENKD